LIKDGLGDLHSGIIAAAYALGLSEARVPKLFNALVFSALGYFDAFETAKREASKTFRAAGFEQVPPFEAWLGASGSFMYTPNHPKICVAIEMAKMIASRMGLATADLNASDQIDDPLSNSVQWPVYPELARRIGISGSTTFVRAWNPTAASKEREIFLPDFVKHCYERYSSIPSEVFRSAVPEPTLATLQKLLV
jgi:Polysaccharide biosynthesis enzyme WcbI